MGADNASAVRADNCWGEKFLVESINENKGRKK